MWLVTRPGQMPWITKLLAPVSAEVGSGPLVGCTISSSSVRTVVHEVGLGVSVAPAVQRFEQSRAGGLLPRRRCKSTVRRAPRCKRAKHRRPVLGAGEQDRVGDLGAQRGPVRQSESRQQPAPADAVDGEVAPRALAYRTNGVHEVLHRYLNVAGGVLREVHVAEGTPARTSESCSPFGHASLPSTPVPVTKSTGARDALLIDSWQNSDDRSLPGSQ
jgi:hypothetical protein